MSSSEGWFFLNLLVILVVFLLLCVSVMVMEDSREPEAWGVLAIVEIVVLLASIIVAFTSAFEHVRWVG